MFFGTLAANVAAGLPYNHSLRGHRLLFLTAVAVYSLKVVLRPLAAL